MFSPSIHTGSMFYSPHLRLLFRGACVDISSCLLNLVEQCCAILTTSTVSRFCAANDSATTSWIEHLIGFTMNIFLLWECSLSDKWGSRMGGLLGASQIVECFKGEKFDCLALSCAYGYALSNDTLMVLASFLYPFSIK